MNTPYQQDNQAGSHRTGYAVLAANALLAIYFLDTSGFLGWPFVVLYVLLLALTGGGRSWARISATILLALVPMGVTIFAGAELFNSVFLLGVFVLAVPHLLLVLLLWLPPVTRCITSESARKAQPPTLPTPLGEQTASPPEKEVKRPFAHVSVALGVTLFLTVAFLATRWSQRNTYILVFVDDDSPGQFKEPQDLEVACTPEERRLRGSGEIFGRSDRFGRLQYSGDMVLTPDCVIRAAHANSSEVAVGQNCTKKRFLSDECILVDARLVILRPIRRRP